MIKTWSTGSYWTLLVVHQIIDMDAFVVDCFMSLVLPVCGRHFAVLMFWGSDVIASIDFRRDGFAQVSLLHLLDIFFLPRLWALDTSRDF